MLILTLRTDKPEAEIGLYEDDTQAAYETWQAHRELAETLHAKIAEKLNSIGRDWHDIEGVVAYKGPGSFTGLRIGLSVANALAYARNIPVVGASGDHWVRQGLELLNQQKGGKVALPDYGAPVHITTQKK